MSDNAGCVFSEMRGNAASYKDKKSLSAFSFLSFCLFFIELHLGECNPS